MKLMNGFAVVTQSLLMQKWVVFTSKTTHFHFETKHSTDSFCIDCIFLYNMLICNLFARKYYRFLALNLFAILCLVVDADFYLLVVMPNLFNICHKVCPVFHVFAACRVLWHY